MLRKVGLLPEGDLHGLVHLLVDGDVHCVILAPQDAFLLYNKISRLLKIRNIITKTFISVIVSEKVKLRTWNNLDMVQIRLSFIRKKLNLLIQKTTK